MNEEKNKAEKLLEFLDKVVENLKEIAEKQEEDKK